MTRRMTCIVVGGTVAALLTWESLASILFLAILGFWRVYPWPDRLWMWTRYAIEAHANAIVLQWLIITGIMSVLTHLLIAALVIRWRIKPKAKPVYGQTDWADRKQMAGRDISATAELP